METHRRDRPPVQPVVRQEYQIVAKIITTITVEIEQANGSKSVFAVTQPNTTLADNPIFFGKEVDAQLEDVSKSIVQSVASKFGREDLPF